MNNPFRYTPRAEVLEAAAKLINRIDSSEELSSVFGEGKMLGVLIVRDCCGREYPLYGFSGNVGGRNIMEGFVPPIFDLLSPQGHFKMKESEISRINCAIADLSSSKELVSLRRRIDATQAEAERVTAGFKSSMTAAKEARDRKRAAGVTQEENLELVRESQREKSELRELKKEYAQKISNLQKDEQLLTGRIDRLKAMRREMSDELQKWIFRHYTVHNALGEVSDIWNIFSEAGLVPPGGTGECAAPKLLEYAYLNGLTPISIGEFWYGKSSKTAVRLHGCFYPSCTSKCGPLLAFMMRGLDIVPDWDINGQQIGGKHMSAVQGFAPDEHDEIPGMVSESSGGAVTGAEAILYRDEQILVVSKESGIPSVPGLSGIKSLQERLEEMLGQDIYAVHRLDMDTSGVMVFALDSKSAEYLQRQFEAHTVRKEYHAILFAGRRIPPKGTIRLPLAPDYHERPRQKVDFDSGKYAVTEFELVRDNDDGTSEVIFRPVTGRTHQLRVHSAHSLGLGSPIAGDKLYGGTALTRNSTLQNTPVHSRLHLHAFSITFRHPSSGEEMTFSSESNSY